MELCVRFDYGRTVPWIEQRQENAWAMAAGTGVAYLRTVQEIHAKNEIATAEFTLNRGEQRSFVLTHANANENPPRRINAQKALRQTEQFWQRWCASNIYKGTWRAAVERSLITLKALTYRPTCGIVAAPTTSLPERLGGDLNWDYRYCWLRDAAFTLESLLSVGYHTEAQAWQEWLLQVVGRDVRGMQIMYGMRGERHLPECQLSWLQGYRKSQPVRMGNAASGQVQLDVYGEVADAIVSMKRAGIQRDPRLLRLQHDLTSYVASICDVPASGLWERRNEKKHYTYSKAMAWLTLNHGVEGSKGKKAEEWKVIRDRLHQQICNRGFSRKLGSFVQSFGSNTLDASVLLLPIFGFLPFEDERVKSTVEVIQKRLGRESFIYRSQPANRKNRECAFMACSFWMVQNLAGVGRRNDAARLFEKLIKRRNDVGLLSEEYDPDNGGFMGNFPQALSHIALINAARALSSHLLSGSIHVSSRD
jgi:GH15 family glucan-1,4-alpha-glucosidase